jgi:membrane associated rhomboid family serine protease
MGIYDRDYYREQRPAFSIRAPQTIVGALILVNVAVWILDFFTQARINPFTDAVVGRWLSDHLAVSGDTLTQPWMWWQFFTYGFAHSPVSFDHILWNMLGLFVFGRDLEWHYGRKEFLRLYLAFVGVGGLAWAIINQIQGGHQGDMVYGASGAVVGTIVLFALNFPHRTILLFFVLPMPAWVLGILLVAGDLYGAFAQNMTRGGSNVAYSVHLAGAAFALLYFRFHWNLGRLVEGRFSLPRLAPRPKLRIHDPSDDEATPTDLSEEVDRILEKIHREGESSLTRGERRTLENASRQYQKKRQQQRL